MVASSCTALLLFIPVVAVNSDPSYGVDCSFPIHYNSWRCPEGKRNREDFYDEFIEGCREYHGKKAFLCDTTEEERLQMSVRQPQSMVNYTSTGFKKIKAPDEVMEMLYAHWEANKHLKEEESWAKGNTYVNWWSSSTYMVAVEDSKLLRGAGPGLKRKLYGAAKSTIEEWTGMELRPTSMYGIRIYTEGAILSPHVDRLPLVSSAIVNVAQDVDEPWPLEVIDRQGRAVNVTMEPGDMVLYESGSLIHARPFPLKGRYFANIFIHFEPTGRPLSDTTGEYLDDLDDFLPPYLLPDSPWVEDWTNENPSGWRRPSPAGPKQHSGASDPHVAASDGDLERLMEIADRNPKALHRRDENGWEGLHEAVRAGFEEAAMFLIENGADKNSRTGENRDGASPLNLALEYHEEDSPIVQYLISIGAEDIADESDEL